MVIVETDGSDFIMTNQNSTGGPFATSGADSILGLGGNDTIAGGAGADSLVGGAVTPRERETASRSAPRGNRRTASRLRWRGMRPPRRAAALPRPSSCHTLLADTVRVRGVSINRGARKTRAGVRSNATADQKFWPGSRVESWPHDAV